MIGPETIFFSKDTKIGKKVTIEPYVVIGSKVKIGDNVIIKSFSHLESCIIERKVEIGPYARIRPDTILKSGSKVGNFVEIKKSIVGKKSKVNHLSYVGDTNIGESVNIGAGTITCNYDGVNKNNTKIKDKVFIGSNSSLVAPVTINKNVPPKPVGITLRETDFLGTSLANIRRKKQWSDEAREADLKLKEIKEI